MTLKECFETIGGDYAGVTARLISQSLVEKFVVKFLNDPSFSQLKAAIESGNGEAAFRASHTLKGISSNLGFSRLYATSSDLTEKLRGTYDLTGCEELFQKVSSAYEETVTAIQSLEK